MRLIRGSAAVGGSLERPVMTIGNFDGIHLGHQAILRTVTRRATDLGGQAVVYTFDPHPRKVLRSDGAPALLTTLEQKLELFELHGVDAVVVEPFTLEFAKTDAETFIRECLHRRIRPIEVYVGYDFHFGRDRTGSMRLLSELGPRLGFAVSIIPEIRMDEGDVNSTRIRRLLAEGLPEIAARMLGRPYAIRGTVVHGTERGRVLGFPTANLDPESEILPAPGVYAGRLQTLDEGDPPSGSVLPVVINVGRRPTFEGRGALIVEAHAIDWNGELYGRRVELSFPLRLREERKFGGPEALRRQIAEDVAEARRRLDIR